MILVDSSVWIDHLRKGESVLGELLNACRVMIHPFIVGEIACGNLKNRDEILTLLQNLPAMPCATDDEVLIFIEKQGLPGKGIGYLDAHLLTSVSLSGTGFLWTRDKRLLSVAQSLGLSFSAGQ
ncbi:MAG: type II toxin-antitoxin system VapC family toxin [Leptospirales bacterium]|jgi:hypothetical protein